MKKERIRISGLRDKIGLTSAEVKSYIERAKEVGCTPDQMERFLSAGYVALPQILPYHAAARAIDNRLGYDEIMIDGTRGSAKSHAIIAQTALDDCQKYPGLKFLFLRQTQRAAMESFRDLVGRVLRYIPHTMTVEKIEFPNGSKIFIGGYKNDDDINKYIGIEYDGLVLEEATQITGLKYELLIGSIRTSRSDWVPRKYLSTNPGGVGHSYFKERFVVPNTTHNETNTRRFYTSYKDNPFINSEYKTYLEGLTGDIAKAWRDGDWDIFSGQAFPGFKYNTHVIKPIEIPQHWVKWRAVDWGMTAPFCCLWFAKEPDTGRIYVYRELYKTGLTDRQQAQAILDMTPEPGYLITYADPSMWAKKTLDNYISSSADEYASVGVPLLKADNNRISGKRKVDRILADLPDGKPGLLIFNICTNLIRTLPSLIYDDTNPEDINTDGEDHAYDALRYGLTAQFNRREVKVPNIIHPLATLKGVV